MFELEFLFLFFEKKKISILLQYQIYKIIPAKVSRFINYVRPKATIFWDLSE